MSLILRNKNPEYSYTWPERLLNAALNDLNPSSFSDKWAPAVDIKEDDNRYVVKADLPGVASKDIDITMENNMLTISGERKSENETNEKGYHRVERTYGSFTRSFSFPQNADADGIKAINKDGVLEISIPKKASSLPKKIQIT
jgi:HSP20 family protein